MRKTTTNLIAVLVVVMLAVSGLTGFAFADDSIEHGMNIAKIMDDLRED